jgi:SAM-dependent methyltransferase
MPACNICGSETFKAAPNNRLSLKKIAPRCAKCGSLERHRLGRDIAAAVRVRDKFQSYTLLDIGADNTVPKGWFASSKIVQANEDGIQLPRNEEAKYDFIVCSHVIQKMRSPREAIQRLLQALSPEGIFLLSYPSPVTRDKTEGLSRRYRHDKGPLFIFGKDFEKEYRTMAPNTYVVAADGTDTVTGDQDIVYLLTKSPFWTTRMVKHLNARLIQ